MKSNAPTTVAWYIKSFPKSTQVLIKKMRATIKKAAPKAEESIGYRMPAYKLNGVLVYFAAYASHIGFYPTPKGIAPFKKELVDFKCSKGAIQFPLNRKIPWALVSKIVRNRVKENLAKSKRTSILSKNKRK
jgi:uncharacterized protein YdhG (YjbR/CyaY superfamily)